MKNYLRFSILLAGILVLSLIETKVVCALDVKSTIAVVDFESVGGEEHLGKAVAEIMRTELIGTGQFRVVERAQISKALSEQQLQHSGLIDDRSAVQIGKFIGADLIIVGSVVKIGDSYTINSRMIDVKTGEAKLGKNVSGNNLNLLAGMSHELIGNLFGFRQKNAPSYDGKARAVEGVKPPDGSSRSLLAGAVSWNNGKAYFFRGNRYMRYDIAAGRVDPGYPKPIDSGTWPGMIWTDGVDAVVNWGNGKA